MYRTLYRTLSVAFGLSLALLAAGQARADVGIVLNESLDSSVARITGSGHSAVYLSRICPASPVKLRLCAPGEQGSVISNYTTLGEDEPFEWNVVPLSVFVYGVEDPRNRPIFSSGKIKAALDENYREQILRDYCEGRKCQTSGGAEWHEMVSASSERTLYILIVSTTVEQDQELVDRFNNAPNVNHFNGVRNNCADFTKHVIDSYFPHAAHRDAINDFGMTSPKAVARSFAHYAHGQPGDEYRVLHFAQLPGTIKRSTECRDGTEQLYHSKKLLVPMAVFAWHALPVVAGSYLLTGRFNPETEFEQHATIRESQLDHEIQLVKDGDDPGAEPLADLEAARQQERSRVLGTEQEWAAYKEKFDALVAEAVDQHLLRDRGSLGQVFKDLNANAKITIDQDGSLWMQTRDGETAVRVGLSADNLLAPGSDRATAYKLMMAHVAEMLKSPPRQRETMPDFVEAWDLMLQARPEPPPAYAMGR